jgi:quinol-cytochrome oxidoreductase complex cytochrome b subunit
MDETRPQVETDDPLEREPQTIGAIPDHLISRATAIVLLLCLLSVLSILWPVAQGMRANPAAGLAGAKPAWYLLFLSQLTRVVPPPIGALMPIGLLVLLGAWPFLDRNASREPGRRILGLGLAVVVIGGIVGLTVMGWVRW